LSASGTRHRLSISFLADPVAASWHRHLRSLHRSTSFPKFLTKMNDFSFQFYSLGLENNNSSSNIKKKQTISMKTIVISELSDGRIKQTEK